MSLTHTLRYNDVRGVVACVAFPVYITALCLSLQRECLTKISNTRAFSRSAYYYYYVGGE